MLAVQVMFDVLLKVHGDRYDLLQASLTMEERAQVQSMAGMGFPPQRVGRAMLRFQGDQTKVCVH